MIAAIVPCFNEETGIPTVITNLLKSNIDLIVIVANGCYDQTVKIIRSYNSPKVKLLQFKKTLGVDVPRAIGAKYAYEQGAKAFLFVDGDMIGNLYENFNELLSSLGPLDLALTNCYPNRTTHSVLANNVLGFRLQLNKLLGLESLGVANPCHGPHALTRNFLEQIDFRYLAKPPLLLSLAKKNKSEVNVATTIPHRMLGSKERDPEHNIKIAHTIIGDCLEAMCHYKGNELTRVYEGINYNGYNSSRKWDTLDYYLK